MLLVTIKSRFYICVCVLEGVSLLFALLLAGESSWTFSPGGHRSFHALMSFSSCVTTRRRLLLFLTPFTRLIRLRYTSLRVLHTALECSGIGIGW